MADKSETSALYSELYDDLFDVGWQSEATENVTQESMEVEEAGSQLATEGESVDTDGHHGDDEATCDDLDLYDDILTEEDCRDKKSYDEMVSKFEVAMETISRLQMENQQLVSSVESLRTSSDNAQMNISSILLTARAEVNRKTQEINQLRKQLLKPSLRDRRRFGTHESSSAASELDTPRKHGLMIEEASKQDQTCPERSYHSQREHNQYIKTERESPHGGKSSHKKSYKELSDRDRKRPETDKSTCRGKYGANTSDKLLNDESYGSSSKRHDSDAKHCHSKRDGRKSKERETIKYSEKGHMFEKTSKDILADRSNESEISKNVTGGKTSLGERFKLVDEDSDGAEEPRQHSLSQTCFTRRHIEKLRLQKEKKSMDREKELSDSMESQVTQNNEKLENKPGRDKHEHSSSTEKQSDSKLKCSVPEILTKNTDNIRSEKKSDEVADKARSEKKSDKIKSERKSNKVDNKHRPEKKNAKVTDKARPERKSDRVDDRTRSEKTGDRVEDRNRSEEKSDRIVTDGRTRSEKKSDRMDDRNRSEKKNDKEDDRTRSEENSDRMDGRIRSEKKSDRMDDRNRSEEKNDRVDDRNRSEKKSDRTDDRNRSEEKNDRVEDRNRSDKKSDRVNDRTRSDKKSAKKDDETRSEKRRDKTDVEESEDVKGQPKRFDLRQLLKSKHGKSVTKKSQSNDSEVPVKDPGDGKSEQRTAASSERVKKASSNRKLLKVDYYLESDKAFLAQLLKSAKDEKRSPDDGAKTSKPVETSETRDLKTKCDGDTEPLQALRDVIDYSDVDNTITVTDLSSKIDEHTQDGREVESKKDIISKPSLVDTGMSQKDSVVSSVNKKLSDIVNCNERNNLSERKVDVNDGTLASEKLQYDLNENVDAKKSHLDKDFNKDTYKEPEVSIPDNGTGDDKDKAVGQFEVEESSNIVPQNEEHEAESAADINSGELDMADPADIGVRRSARIKSQETKNSNIDVSCTENTVAQVHEQKVEEDDKNEEILKTDSMMSKNKTIVEEVAVCKSNKQNSDIIVSPKQNKTSRRKSSEKDGQPFRGVFSETISSVTSSDVTHIESDINTTVVTETSKVEVQKASPNKFCGKLNCNMKVNHLHPKGPKYTSPLKGKNLSTSPNQDNDVNSDQGEPSNETNGKNETSAVEGTNDVSVPDNVTLNHEATKPIEKESRLQRDVLLEDLSMNSGSSGSFGSNILTERTKSPDSSSDSSGSSSDSSGSEYSDSEYETAQSGEAENQSDDEDMKSSLSASGDHNDSVQSVKAGKEQILEAVVSSLTSNIPDAATEERDESGNAPLNLKANDSREVQEVNNSAEITEPKTVSESEETNNIAKDKPKYVNSLEKQADKALVDDSGMSVVNSGNDSEASKDGTTKTNKQTLIVRTTEQMHEAVKTTPEKRRPCANEVPSVLTESPDKSFLLQSLLCGVESVIESKQFDVKEKADITLVGKSGSKTNNNSTENKEIKVDNPRERELLEADLFGEPLSSDSSEVTSSSECDSDTDSSSDGSDGSSSSSYTCSCSDCGSDGSSSSSSASSSSRSSSDTSTSESETSSSDEQDPMENIGEKQPGMIPSTSIESKSVVDSIEKNIDECKKQKCETEPAENKYPKTETESKHELFAKEISPCVLKISRQQTDDQPDVNHEDDLSKREEMANQHAKGDIQIDQNPAFSVTQRQPNHIEESTEDLKTKDNKKENAITREINRNVDKDRCEEHIDISDSLKQIPPIKNSQNRIEHEREQSVRMANQSLPMQHGMKNQIKRKCSRERENAELMADNKDKSKIATKSDTEVGKHACGEKECDQGDKQVNLYAVKNIQNDVRDSDRFENSEKQAEEKVKMSRAQKENDSSNTSKVADMGSLSAESKNQDCKNKGTVESSHSTSDLKKCFNSKNSEKQRSELEDMNSMERKSDLRSKSSYKKKDEQKDNLASKTNSKNKTEQSGINKNEVLLKKPEVDNKIPEKQQKVTDTASKIVRDGDKHENSNKIFKDQIRNSKSQKESNSTSTLTRKGTDMTSLSITRKNPDCKVKKVDSSHSSSGLKRCLDSKMSTNVGSESEEMKSLESIISHLRSKSGNRKSDKQTDNQTSKTVSKTETEQTNDAVQKKTNVDKKVPENLQKHTNVASKIMRDSKNIEKKMEDKVKRSNTQKESHSSSSSTRKAADVASLSSQSKKQDSKIKSIIDSSHSSSDLKTSLDSRKSEKQGSKPEDLSVESVSHLRYKSGNRKSDEEKNNLTSQTFAKNKNEQTYISTNVAFQKKQKVDKKVPDNRQKVIDVASKSTRLSDSKSCKEKMNESKEKLTINNKVTRDKKAVEAFNAKGLIISPERSLGEVTSCNLESYRIPKRKPVCIQHTSKRKQIEKESREAMDNKKRSWDRHRKESSVRNKVDIPDKKLDKRPSKQTASDKQRHTTSTKAKSKPALSKEFLSSSDSEDEGLVSSDSEETSDNSDRLVEAIFGKNGSSTESQKSMKYSDICRTRSSEDTDDIVKEIVEETGHDRKTTVTRKRVRKISSDTESENGAKHRKSREKEASKSDTQNVETVTKGNDLVSPRTHVVQQASRLVSELIESKANKRNTKTSKAKEAKKLDGIKDYGCYEKGKELERKSHTKDSSDSSHKEKSHTIRPDKDKHKMIQDSGLGENRKTKPDILESDSQSTKELKRSEKINVVNLKPDVGKEANKKENEVVTKDDADINKGNKLESMHSTLKETKSLNMKLLVENDERMHATDVLTLDIHDEETLDFLDCSEEKDSDLDSESDCESESDSSSSSGSSEEGEISDESDTDKIKVIRSPAKPYKLFQENPASPKKLTLNNSFNTKLKIGTKFSPIKFPPSPAEGKNISKRLDMDTPDQHTPRRKSDYKRKYASDSASDTDINSSRNHLRSGRKSARKYDSPTIRKRSVSSERKPRHRMRSRSPKRFSRNRSRSKSPRSRHKSGSLSPKYRRNERTDRRQSGYNKDNRPTPPRRQRSSSRDSATERRRLRFAARNSHRKDRFNSSTCSGSYSDKDRHNKRSRHDANNRLKSPQESSDDSDKETRSRFRESGCRGRDSCKKRRGKSESECSDKDDTKSEKHVSRKSRNILDRRDSESERTVNKSPSRVIKKERELGGSKKVERDHSLSDSEQLGTKKRKRRHFRSSTDYETDSDQSFVENKSTPVLKKSRKDI